LATDKAASDAAFEFALNLSYFACLSTRDISTTPKLVIFPVMNGFRPDCGAKAYADLSSIATIAHLNSRDVLSAFHAALTVPLRAMHFMIMG
jgi:hypothetical protein